MDQIRTLLDRPKLYNNIDGVGELGASILCLGYSLILLLIMRSPAESVWHRSSFLFFVGMLLLIHYGTKAVKTRITYPRTGFVEHRKQWRTAAIGAGVGALATFALTVVFRRRWDNSMLASLGWVVLATGYGYNAAKALRWKWFIAGAMAVASLVITFLPVNFVRAVGREFPARPDQAKFLGTILLSAMVYGALLMISGGISFWLYLRHTRPPAQEGQ